METLYNQMCPGCFEEKGTASTCPQCGYDESKQHLPVALPHRTRLSTQYLVGRVLGKPGGYGITYLGWDTRLHTRIAIKEHFPRDWATRETNRSTVIPYSREEEEMFRYGLEQFLQEARTLARLDHPNIVRVRHFFEENNTAYLVMDYYEGMTLEQYLQQKGGKLTQSQAVAILMPILDGLREVHRKGFLHRDIKPHNIYLTSQGQAILLDFGAARIAMRERSRSLSVILTPGFSPFEQYHQAGQQGPWTDIYACAATLYYLVTGQVPPEATDRQVNDQLVPPEQLVDDISPDFSAALMRALATELDERPQQMDTFQEELISTQQSPEQARVQSLLNQAQAESEAGNYEKVIAHCQQVLARQPDNAEAQSHIESAQHQLALQEEAKRQRREKRRLALAQLKKKMKVAITYGSIGLVLLLIIGLTLPYIHRTQQIRQILNRAQKQHKAHDYQGTIETLKPIWEIAPNNTTAMNLEGNAKRLLELLVTADRQFKSKDYQQAIETSQKVLSLAPDNPTAKNIRDKAQQQHRIEQETIQKLHLDAIAQYNGGKYQDAIETLQELLKRDPDHVAATNLLQEVKKRQQKERQIQERLTEAKNRYNLEYYKAAFEALQAVLEIDPSNREATNLLPKAMFQLGWAYANGGKDVPRDNREAVNWYEKAADKGIAEAMTNLGTMYAHGQGVPPDYGKANLWYTKAAELGEAMGMYYLGWMYEDGIGVEKNIEDARYWYKRAVDSGYETAQEALRRLNGTQ